MCSRFVSSGVQHKFLFGGKKQEIPSKVPIISFLAARNDKYQGGVNHFLLAAKTRNTRQEGGSNQPRCEMDKFGLMMRHFKEHALAADRELETFKRIWAPAMNSLPFG